MNRIMSKHNKNTMRGFSLLTTLFVIIILSLLAAALFRMTQSGNIAVAQEVLSIRAFFAAETGAQAMAMDIFPLAGAGVCTNRTINFTANGLVGCRASVVCTTTIVNGENYYRVTSQGQCAIGSEKETSRTLNILLKDI